MTAPPFVLVGTALRTDSAANVTVMAVAYRNAIAIGRINGLKHSCKCQAGVRRSSARLRLSNENADPLG